MNPSMLFFLALALLLYVGFSGAQLFIAFKKARTTVSQTRAYEHDAVPKILVLGDSTALGVGASPEGSTAFYVSEHFGLGVENRAQSGARLADVHMQLAVAKEDRYEMILIQVGANDIIYFGPLRAFNGELKEIIKNATQKSSRVAFLTSGNIGTAPIWPFPLNVLYSYRTRVARDQALAVIRGHAPQVAYVDLYAKNITFVKEDYAPDELHLSALGYKKWADQIIETVEDTWEELKR